MNIIQILESFARDEQVKAVAVLLVADVVLGVLAAVKMGTFRLTYLSNFLRNDVVGKVAPWFALFAVGKVSGASVVGVDFGTAADAAWVVLSAALVGSLLSSLADLGINLPASIAGHSTPSSRRSARTAYPPNRPVGGTAPSGNL